MPETQENITAAVGDHIIPETQDVKTCDENWDAEFINEAFYKTLINLKESKRR